MHKTSIVLRVGIWLSCHEYNLVARAEQPLAADGAIASFSSNFFLLSLNADRAPQLKRIVRLLTPCYVKLLGAENV
jgi:hypothetical protein